jgi:hypothetical protein
MGWVTYAARIGEIRKYTKFFIDNFMLGRLGYSWGGGGKFIFKRSVVA